MYIIYIWVTAKTWGMKPSCGFIPVSYPVHIRFIPVSNVWNKGVIPPFQTNVSTRFFSDAFLRLVSYVFEIRVSELVSDVV